MGFFKKEIQVIDVLQEWRKVEVGGGFNMFDKVLVTKYGQEKVAVIGGKFSDGDLFLTYKDGGYEWYKGNGNIRLYYGEFQAEMEALEESKNKMKEVEELSKQLAKARDESLSLYEKGKRVVENNVKKQFIL